MNLPPEQAVTLGARAGLIGILTRPSAEAANPDAPAVVILNAGVLSRVGPARLSVDLARSLASRGHLALRFDQSGIGDSERRDEASTPLAAVMADIREVIDWLESQHGIRRVVLAGLCAGADHSLFYAGTDGRVVGAVLLDPNVPRTRGYFRRYYARRLARPSAWLGAIGRLIGSGRTPDGAAPSAVSAPEFSVDQPGVRAEFSRAHRRMVEAGNAMLVILTGGLPARHCYRNQLVEAFPEVAFGDRLQSEFFADADHNFEARHARVRMLDTVSRWCATPTRFRPVSHG